METLTLNDGTVLENSYAVETTSNLFLYVKGKTLMEVALLLSDPTKTENITYHAGRDFEKIFVNYTNLISISSGVGDIISCAMKR